MRRFFQVQRDEDYSQIQYLTVKCNRLAREKAMLETECMLSRERVWVLQVELETVCLQLRQKENTIQELTKKLQHQQHPVSESDAALLSVHLESISSELQYLQSTEKQLIGFVDKLHQEAQDATKKAEDLEVQLHQEAELHAWQTDNLQKELERKSHDLQELQKAHDALQQELSEHNCTRQKTVLELECENATSVHKLREMAERVEWLCEQQRNWICCIKRFKDCLNDEKEALVLQVNRLQEELLDLRKKSKSEMTDGEDTEPKVHCSSWDVDAMLDLQVEADKWKHRYLELFGKFTSHQVDCHEDGYLKPP
ncbi:GRIP and coiled-coil domain-containing protein 2 [Neoarius graeffei]|uniref:GRIP and coiled-coil domain-containing protein 2 n=1 Tax=Neoarius graeffei TaxID=443677 RepID=UPI00298C9C92|nr:GRIP and coiled-coil domain-containing protein 2 [Neoarius graeffei]